MNKFLIILLVIGGCVVLGAGIYFGLQALEPRTYLNNPISDTRNQNNPSVETDASPPPPTPTIVSASVSTSTLSILTTENTVSLASDTEKKAYFAAATPHEINPATLKLNILDTRAQVYSGNEIIISERPSASLPTSIWKFNSSTKTLTPVIEKERGLMATWSPNGHYALLFSLLSQSTPTLRFINTQEGNLTPIRFTTIPTKCTVTNDQIIYCGLPKALPPGTILPDDYLKKKIYTNDALIMIDIKNTRIESIFNELEPALDVHNPVRIGDTLLFVNRRDEKVYKIEL